MLTRNPFVGDACGHKRVALLQERAQETWKTWRSCGPFIFHQFSRGRILRGGVLANARTRVCWRGVNYAQGLPEGKSSRAPGGPKGVRICITFFPRSAGRVGKRLRINLGEFRSICGYSIRRGRPSPVECFPSLLSEHNPSWMSILVIIESINMCKYVCV